MQNEFRRILIVGNGGSGKTTLSLKLTQILYYPVLHLDSMYWIDGWKKNSTEVFEKNTRNFVKSDCWIIEGTPMHDIQYRLTRADTIIFLNVNRMVCILRLIKRAIKNIFLFSTVEKFGGPANSFSIKAAIWIWKFDSLKRKTIMSLINAEKRCSNCSTQRLRIHTK